MPGPAPALAGQEASMTTLLEKNHGPANGHGGMEAIKHATTNFSPTLLVNITLLENTWFADLHVGEPIQLITPAFRQEDGCPSPTPIRTCPKRWRHFGHFGLKYVKAMWKRSEETNLFNRYCTYKLVLDSHVVPNSVYIPRLRKCCTP